MACAITTIDNPYDPFTQFELWLAYDLEKGYNSCAYLSRVTLTSDQMSSKEEEEEIERGIDEIIKHDVQNIYKKVVYLEESA